MLGVGQKWLEERILKGLVKNDYEPKEYPVKSGVTCIKNTQGVSQEWAQRILTRSDLFQEYSMS